MYQLIMLSGLKHGGHGLFLSLVMQWCPGKDLWRCLHAGLWLQAAEAHQVHQLLEQGQALHPKAPSGMGRWEPEKGYQPKRWLLSWFSMVKYLCTQPMTEISRDVVWVQLLLFSETSWFESLDAEIARSSCWGTGFLLLVHNLGLGLFYVCTFFAWITNKE